MQRAHPGDLSVATCAALTAIASKDNGRMQAALERLAGIVDKTPLDNLAAGVKANAREQAQAAEQIPLWLVARAGSWPGQRRDPGVQRQICRAGDSRPLAARTIACGCWP